MAKSENVEQYLKPKKRWRVFFLIFALLVFALLAWLGTNFFLAFSKITSENTSGKAPFLSFLGQISPSQLKGEGDGRINILLLGIGGKNHPGGNLTDTIMVASIDPKNKNLALLSIPRDLSVPIEGYGSGKINVAYSVGETNAAKTGGGAALVKKTVSKILDLPIHYYVLMDFEGFKKIVDTLGGVEIYVDKAISDPYYPDPQMKGYQPFYLSAGLVKMNGELALKYARSRETTSDFDRSKRQQKLISAIADKTFSLGTLTNPKKITDIIQILGSHLKTDLSFWEAERLVTTAKDIKSDKIVTKVLDNTPDGPLVSSGGTDGYYLKPKGGDFKEIQRIAHEIFSEPYLTSENAKIEILNGSSKTGAANNVAQLLQSYGYQVVKIGNYSEKVQKTFIYDYTSGQKPFTVKFLSDRFKAKVITKTENSSKIDLSLILGEDFQ